MNYLTDYQLARLKEIREANDAGFFKGYFPSHITSTDLALVNFDLAEILVGKLGGMQITAKGRAFLDELANN